MAAKIKTNQLAGYENTAFNYRYLNTTLTPLSLMEAFHLSVPSGKNPGRWIVDTLIKDINNLTEVLWLNYLRSARTTDRAYRLLADEYYRQLDVAERSNVDA